MLCPTTPYWQDLTEEGTSQDESPLANLPPLRKFDFRACPGIGAIDIFKSQPCPNIVEGSLASQSPFPFPSASLSVCGVLHTESGTERVWLARLGGRGVASGL